MLVVHGTDDDTVPYSNSDDFLQAGRSRDIRTERVTIEGADHTYDRVDWRDEAVESTVAFLKETL